MSGPTSPTGADNSRILRFSPFVHRHLGGPARKVPLDAGFTCPNRDGSLSRSGCVFCPPAGAGTGLFASGVPLQEQWNIFSGRIREKYPNAKFIAYLQAYTNTHCSTRELRALLNTIAALPGVAGLCLGTRPDCLDMDAPAGAAASRLEVLAEFAGTPGSPGKGGLGGHGFLQLDLGLQSADDTVLARIGRGHDAACFAKAARAAAQRGLHVCAHIMDGLPGAAEDDLCRSVDFLNALPITGIKFHNTMVCRGTALEHLWRTGAYVPPDLETYTERLMQAIALLRPDICIQRMAADPNPGELVAPDWVADKSTVFNHLEAALIRLDVRQGQNYRASAG